MKQYTIEKAAETRAFYTFEGKCLLGGQLIVEVSECKPDNTSVHSLPVLWKKHGFIDRVLENYWSIQVFAYDADGHCYGMYNPQHKGNKLNFDWMLEATPGNLEKLLDKVCELAFGEAA